MCIQKLSYIFTENLKTLTHFTFLHWTFTIILTVPRVLVNPEWSMNEPPWDVVISKMSFKYTFLVRRVQLHQTIKGLHDPKETPFAKGSVRNHMWNLRWLPAKGKIFPLPCIWFLAATKSGRKSTMIIKFEPHSTWLQTRVSITIYS